MELDLKLVTFFAAATTVAAIYVVRLIFSRKDDSVKPKNGKNKSSENGASSKPIVDYSPKKIAGQGSLFSPVTKGSSSSELRGYKKTADGRMTTYFHRELTEEEKKLLGDSKPKQINAESVTIDSNEKNSQGGSAWNAAGTWEEKNYTQWAKARIKELFSDASASIPASSGAFLGGSVKVSSITSTEGEAAITFVRGRKRYIYDMTITVQWILKLGNGENASGSMTITDVNAECNYEFAVTSNSEFASSTALRNAFNKYVKSSASGLQPVLTKQLNKFLSDFKSLDKK